MKSPVLSLVMIVGSKNPADYESLTRLTQAIRATGFSYEILVGDDGSDEEVSRVIRGYAGFDRSMRIISVDPALEERSALRKLVLEADGEVVCITPADASFRIRDFEYSLAMVHSGTTDILYGLCEPNATAGVRPTLADRFNLTLSRWIIGPVPRLLLAGLRIFTADAARVLFTETRLGDANVDYEVLYLANRYGFRLDAIPIAMVGEGKPAVSRPGFQLVRDAFRIRRLESQQRYRPPRRCPVCFSPDVRTRDQVSGWVIRVCRRCKCRYLGFFPTEALMVRARERRIERTEADLEEYEARRLARARTYEKRLGEIRREVPPRGRVLEIGARRGDLGEVINREFDYVGIELSDAAARAARARGLEVYRASVENYVTFSGGFDAVVMFDVFEHLPNPHDALGRIRDRLKPGGVLLFVTPDTQSFTSIFSGERWSAHKVPEHLILYSRPALVELLEHSGFEIVSATSDYQYFDHQRIRTALLRWPRSVGRLVETFLRLLPDPLLASVGSIRVVARRRSGSPYAMRPVPVVEAAETR
jgi:SAM-dependent methyltransferase